MDESRFLFDQLAVMAPIMMALTASTPVLRGRIADTDARWGIISECVDDRRPAERGREGGPEPDPEVAGKSSFLYSRSSWKSAPLLCAATCNSYILSFSTYHRKRLSEIVQKSI